MHTDTPEKLLTTAEVADILRVERNTLAKWRVEGRPPRHVKIGRSTVAYDPADVRDFIESRKRASTAAERPAAAAAR